MDVCKQSPVRLPRFNTKNHWHSIDDDFQDGAVSVTLLCVTRIAANTSFMNGCNQSPLRLQKMHCEQSLTLCWHPYSEWGSDCRLFFGQERLPVRWLWIASTRSLSITVLLRPKIVDTNFQDWAGSELLILLTRKAANTSFMNGCNQSPLRLLKMHSQKSLTFHYHPLSEWGSDCVVYSFAKKGWQYVGYK